MARKVKIERSKHAPKFSTRQHNRCQQCGRPRGYYRDFGLCRICLRKNGNMGLIPGLIKASW